VVILGSIPQVGYLTDFDVWIFNMFVMLAACVFAHQLVVNSFRKVEQWPFRAVIIRLIEMTGRVVIIPLCLNMFASTFEGDELSILKSYYLRIPMISLFLLLMIREAFGVRKAVKNGMVKICEKIEEGKRKNSWWELFITNLIMFNVIDFTKDPYMAKLKRMKRMTAGKNGSMELTSTVNKLHEEEESDPKKKRRPSKRISLLGRLRRQYMYDSDDVV
jgi:hypothetical protein